MKRIFCILIALVVLFAAALVVLSWHEGRYRRAVEAYKRELLAKGEKLKMIELAPAEVSDAERVKAFIVLMGGYHRPTNLPSMMTIVAPGVAAVGHTRLAPDQMADYENNVNLVARLREILGTNTLTFRLDYTRTADMPLPGLAWLQSAELLAAGAAMQALGTERFEASAIELVARGGPSAVV